MRPVLGCQVGFWPLDGPLDDNDYFCCTLLSNGYWSMGLVFVVFLVYIHATVRKWMGVVYGLWVWLLFVLWVWQ